VAAAGRPLLVVSDFDGTLSPIVRDADRAGMVPSARDALARLAAAEGVRVVILSGRGAADVANRVGIDGVRYLGEHGIEEATVAGGAGEGADPGDPTLDPAAEAAGHEIAAVAEEVAERLGRPWWLWIERKRAASGLHFRHADEPEAARATILAAIGDRYPGIAVLESRRIVELRPAFATGKDAATRRMLAEVDPAAAVALGDDQTDVAMFRAVVAWRRETRRAALVVGVSAGDETPTEVPAASDAMVASPEAAADLLSALADAVEVAVGTFHARDADAT
jgi:trehalose 6-phosphate phosphatase